MKYVGCPTCDLVFETEGFRPIMFFCPECNTEGDWYAADVDGEPRGCIEWTPDLTYIEDAAYDFQIQIELQYEEEYEYLNNSKGVLITYLETSAGILETMAESIEPVDRELAEKYREAAGKVRALIPNAEADCHLLMELFECNYELELDSILSVEREWYNLAVISDDLSSDFPEMVQKDNKSYVMPMFQECIDDFLYLIEYYDDQQEEVYEYYQNVVNEIYADLPG